MIEHSFTADFHFLRPWWLLLLAFIALTLYLLKDRTAYKSSWYNLIAPHLLSHLFSSKNNTKLFHPLSTFIAMSILATIILAGPSWQRESTPFARDQSPLIILLDLSNTMNQQDVKPSRLIRTQQKIQDLMSLRGNAPTSLIAYAGTAHRVIPLTDDPYVISLLANTLTTQLMPQSGKFLDRTIALLESDLKVPGNILLMTDAIGPGSLNKFSEYCKQTNNNLLVYGVGSINTSSAKIVSDYKSLKALAKACNGYFQRMTVDKGDIEVLIQKLAHTFIFQNDKNRPWKDMGYYLLFPLAIISLLWFRQGWTLNWVLVIGILGSPMHSNSSYADELSLLDLLMTKDQQGQYYFNQKQYSKAASSFRNPMNKGIAFYQAEEFDAAVDSFASIDSIEGLFYRANALAHGRRYVAAIKIYDLILKQNKDHQPAQKNRKIVKKIVDEVNQMSEAQQAEIGEQSEQLGKAPKTGEGAKKMAFETRKIKQLSAEQLLNNPALNEIWMRQVEPDPANFLKVKFLMQQADGPKP